MAQVGYTPISLYYSATSSATPSAGNLANGELALNITDGRLFYKDNGGVVRVLATAAGSAGDVVGPGSSTDNALVRFDGTTGKLVQNSVGVLSDAGALSGLTSVAATTFTGALTGNASTATTLQTSRTIWGQSFDGSANVTGALTGVTDLTASGSLTLSGGTANGVAYLNGSKVLTTGSALTFNGSLLGVGRTATGLRVEVDGNFGLNTATPPGVNGSGISIYASDFPRLSFRNSTTGDTSSDGLQIYMVGNDVSYNLTESGYQAWMTGGSEQMRLTSTGLGIGTSSPTAKLVVAGGGLLGTNSTNPIAFTGSSGDNAGIGSYNANTDMNIYAAGTGKIKFRAGATWSSAGVLTAIGPDLAIIDSSGNLGLGTTSPASYGAKFVNYAASGPSWNVVASGANQLYMGFDTSVGVNAIESNGVLMFATKPGFSESARIDSSGNLLVGTTGSFTGQVGEKLVVHGPQTGGGGAVAYVYNTSASGADSSPALNLYKAMTTTSSSARFMQFYANSAGTPMGGIVGNGASNVQFASISDAREKTNITPINGSLEKIVSLNPVKFDWISNGEHCPAGFVAQDVEQVFPEFVVENMANEGQEARKGLTGGMTGGIVAHLVKAIQEQQAIITALTARVAALESN